MLKRLSGSAMHRKYETQCREIVLRAITHNVMIVRLRVFYRASFGNYSVNLQAKKVRTLVDNYAPN